MSGYRTLLMPIGLGGDAEERIAGALAIAKRFEAHLQVLFTYVSPRQSIPEDIFGVSKTAMHSLAQAADRHAEEVGADLHARFLELCQGHGVALAERPAAKGASAAWRPAHGDRSRLIGVHGRLADLIVLSPPAQARPSASFEAALLETGKPVLLMPRRQRDFKAGRILVGWNGSREAARAVTDALPMLAAAQAVVVVATEDCAQADPSLEAVQAYLSSHGVPSATEILEPNARPIGQALIEAARAHAADLMVIGGYSRPRMREMIFGGVTLEILSALEVPVLMAH